MGGLLGGGGGGGGAKGMLPPPSPPPKLWGGAASPLPTPMDDNEKMKRCMHLNLVCGLQTFRLQRESNL